VDWSSLWIQDAVYVATNLVYKLMVVGLFLLVTSLKCCEVLFPLDFQYSAQKRAEILVFKIKHSHSLCSQEM